MEVQTISKGDQRYPSRILGHERAPEVFYVKGNAELLNKPCIAIIGTRYPTKLGLAIAHALAVYFASHGYVILSGLAIGIDAAAHQGALSVPGGETIAVLGTPLWNIQPQANWWLADEILERGSLLLTEYDTYVFEYVKRDYLQALLSEAVIPVQGGVKSGTRHACYAALTEGIHLFLPEPVPRSEQAYPKKYELIRELMKDERAITFRGKEEYPFLLNTLKE